MDNTTNDLITLARDAIQATKTANAELVRVISTMQTQIDRTNQYIADMRAYQDTTTKGA